jgi:CubicO group peptidase (beta-lactamase class C family)
MAGDRIHSRSLHIVLLRIGFLLFVSLTLTLTITCRATEEKPSAVYPGEQWKEASSPEAYGWSSEKLERARDYSKRIGSAAVMIVDDGVVVGAWGDITRKYECHSMRKSLLSALIGIHVEEGNIDLSKTMEDLDIDDYEPALTPDEKQATVSDLIKARSGIYHPALGESGSMKALRPKRHSHAPGTFWFYNNWDFNALGTIFEQETGNKIFEEFERLIARPLQMKDFQVSDCRYNTWENYAEGRTSMHRYYLFRMSARDLARFGLLFLREGRWRERQIITPDWIRESTAAYSRRGVDSGYGYMWWTGVKGGLFPDVKVREHSYHASGVRGHKIIVLPYRKLVVVHRVDTDRSGPSVDEKGIGRLLWLILDAAGDTDIGEGFTLEETKGERISADGLKELFGGGAVRIQSRTGPGMVEGADKPVLLSCFPDGTVSQSVAGELFDNGHWWLEDNRFCVAWEKRRKDLKECVYLVLEGSSIKWFDLEGILAGKGVYSR